MEQTNFGGVNKFCWKTDQLRPLDCKFDSLWSFYFVYHINVSKTSFHILLNQYIYISVHIILLFYVQYLISTNWWPIYSPEKIIDFLRCLWLINYTTGRGPIIAKYQLSPTCTLLASARKLSDHFLQTTIINCDTVDSKILHLYLG